MFCDPIIEWDRSNFQPRLFKPETQIAQIETESLSISIRKSKIFVDEKQLERRSAGIHAEG